MIVNDGDNEVEFCALTSGEVFTNGDGDLFIRTDDDDVQAVSLRDGITHSFEPADMVTPRPDAVVKLNPAND